MWRLQCTAGQVKRFDEVEYSLATLPALIAPNPVGFGLPEAWENALGAAATHLGTGPAEEGGREDAGPSSVS